MKLLIVESPAKAKTISKYLDNLYTVKASVGHIRDLPKSNKKAIDIENGFIPHYEISPGKEKVVSELKSLSKKADEVLLATDPDREGEAIAWHIKEAIGLKNPKRVVFHEITKEAVQEAINHPRDIDDNLRKAQEARRVLDRLVGYDLSGLIWKKVRYGLSAGRVQSPALRILMEREREIRAFKSEKYWNISADVLSASKTPFTLICIIEPRDNKEVERIVKIGNEGNWTVIGLDESEAKRTPRPPFITSTLQQSASTRLGMSPSRTMGVAQKLYEEGFITYMRTDSTALSSYAQNQIGEVVGKKFGQELYVPRVFSKKSKNAQEAHEAIRPTHLSDENVGHTPEQKSLYKLIWQRTVASQMSDARILRTKMTANVIIPSNTSGQAIPDFTINGSRVINPGWLLADPDARSEDVELPKVTVGEKLTLKEIKTEEKETQPPFRYSEAGLIKELEKRGIGRPSTYASIIKTLEERGYVDKINKALNPTDTGDVVSSFLEQNFGNYISDTFTAEMEDKLDTISRGEIDYEKTLKDFYKPFSKDVKSKEKMEKVTNLGEADNSIVCPKCSSSMVIKLSKNGKFLSCSKFPECNGARTMEGKELEGPKELDEICPKCGKSKLVEREGRFGKFISCGSYPKCKFIKKDAELERQNSTGVKCPLCKDGMMTERRGRFGLFYSCSNYPDCKNAIKAKPTGKLCPVCGALMMEGTKTIPERCSVKTCPNHNPHKLV
ncbi:MAG: type I DNA topoisomerase [Patescibacteria group bacterium]|nr:type I DNA topoisomerase [Patescibacteria group bacterium]